MVSFGWVFLIFSLLMVGLVSSSRFEELYQPSWAFDHLTTEGEILRMKLDHLSGTFDIFSCCIILHILFVMFCLIASFYVKF